MIFVIAQRREHMMNWAREHKLSPSKLRQINSPRQMYGLRDVNCVKITLPDGRSERDHMLMLVRELNWNILPENTADWSITAFVD